MPRGMRASRGPSSAAMIHLASKSPRRRLLLDQIGVDYTIVDAPIDEVRRPGEPPKRFVERMAREKAQAGLAALGDARTAPVLAADTAVVLDEQVLGKPRDEGHAIAMLRALSGRMHRVISAVAIAGIRAGDAGNGLADTDGHGPAAGSAAGSGADPGADPDADPGADPGADDTPRVMTSVSRVWFREITPDERRSYCASGEPLDKAGAYAIQGRAAIFVARLDGSFSAVMGLPLFETASLLREAGIAVWGPPFTPHRRTRFGS